MPTRTLLTMSMSWKLLLPLLWICSCKASDNYISQVQNYVKLVSGYYQEGYSTLDYRPLADVSNVMTVRVGIYLYAINGFDEVAGNIELVAALHMKWQDDVARIRSIVFDLSGKKDFLVPYEMIWTPKLILVNAIGDTSEVGDPAYMCRYNMETSNVSWKPRVVMSASCTPDVTYYPFDQQVCEFIYSPWVFRQDEIILEADFDEWDLNSYGESGEWDIVSTKTETYVENDVSHIRFKLGMRRKPLYFAFNILLPVLVLCLLNSTVFLLPAESGERVGFSVTCFLSFMVLLNMIMDIMPRSSSPISFLCFYLVIMMSNSGAMTLVTILLMRVYHKPEKSTVPKWLQRTVTFLQCGCAKIRCCVLCCRTLKAKCWCPDQTKCGCKTPVNKFSEEDELIEISVDKDNIIKEKPNRYEDNTESNIKSSKRTTCQNCFKIDCVKHDKKSGKICCFGCVIGFRNCIKKENSDQFDGSKGEDAKSSAAEVGEDEPSTGCFCRLRKPRDNVETHVIDTSTDTVKMNGLERCVNNRDADEKKSRFPFCLCIGRPVLGVSDTKFCPDCHGAIEVKSSTCTVCSKTFPNKTTKEKDSVFSCFGKGLGFSKDNEKSDPTADVDNDILPESDRYRTDPSKNKTFTGQEKLDTEETLLQHWKDATSNKKANALNAVEKTSQDSAYDTDAKDNKKAKPAKKTKTKTPTHGHSKKHNESALDKNFGKDNESDISDKENVSVRKIVRDSVILSENKNVAEQDDKDETRWAISKYKLPGKKADDPVQVTTKSTSSKRSQRSRASKGNRSVESRRHFDDESFSESSDDDSLADLEEDVSWAEVGRILDTFFLLAFAGGQAFFTVVFLIPLFTSDGGGGATV